VKVIVNRSKGLARFALMHCIAASLCFWLYAIKNETIDSIVDKKHFYQKNYECEGGGGYGDEGDVDGDQAEPYADGDNSADDENERTQCYTPETLYCLAPVDYQFRWDVTCLLAKECRCSDSNDIAKYIFDVAPYLYPFSIEFSILVVAVWYIMWSNIGKVAENAGNLELLPGSGAPNPMVVSSSSSAGHANQTSPRNNALYLYADCHSSMKGLFFGLAFTAVAIIGIAIFFILSASDDCDTKDMGDKVNHGFEIIMLLIMIVVTLWVYAKLSLLDVNPHPISFLDDLLLFICVPCFFFYAIVHMAPIVKMDDNVADMLSDILMVTQMILQTPMIMDGLRRCSDTADNQDKKPGRNLVAFLLVCNLAIYAWETMEIKAAGDETERKDFYGDNLWTLLSHLTLPLVIFYRFHASVALADIWGSAYRPGDHH